MKAIKLLKNLSNKRHYLSSKDELGMIVKVCQKSKKEVMKKFKIQDLVLMNNEESKKFCYDLLKASNADEVVDLLRRKNFWDDESVWNDYGDNQIILQR